MELIAKDKISITRIEGGVPFIKANHHSDIYFGLGYVHAMDRGMQMMLMKILGKGTASEHLGADHEMLEIDKFFRRMNWHNDY